MSARESVFALLLLVALPACRGPGPVPESRIPPLRYVEDLPAVEFTDAPPPLDAEQRLPARFTVADAARRAVAASPEVAAAAARIREAAAGARGARLLPNPVLSFSWRIASGGGPGALELGLAGDLLRILARTDRSAVEDARLHAAVQEAVTVTLDTAAEAAGLAVGVLEAAERLPLMQDRVDVLRRVGAVARGRTAAGEGRPLDETVAEAEAVAAEIERAEAEAQLHAARLALARRLGRPGDDLRWTVDPGPVPETSGDADAWIAAALERRSELLAADREIAALEAEARAAGFEAWDGAAAGVAAEGSREWDAGPAVDLPLPLFDDGSARRDALGARIAAARHGRMAAARAVVEEVRAALAASTSAAGALHLVEERLLPLAERRHRETAAIFASGEADLTDLLLAERALLDARMRRVEHRARALRAALRLHRAAGGAPRSSRLPAPVAPTEGGSR